jgi:hypothetical protein
VKIPPRWWSATAERQEKLWRAVEAQHLVATMRLADNAAEQDVLEQLLERSKPALPAEQRRLHYLVFTPFRYVASAPSRFRAASHAGVWYGAERVETSLAEVAYWRWRFLRDSEAFDDEALAVQFTVFQATVTGRHVDLTAAPWASRRTVWTHPSDYGGCQTLAQACLQRDIVWIRYESVRDPQGGACGAVLHAEALSVGRHLMQQTWAARLTRDNAVFSNGQQQRLEFDAAQWTA